MTLRLAFSGTGYISQIHAKAAQKLPGVELVAVVNHRPESRAKFADTFGIPRQYATIEELLADGDLDAISVNTPNYLHAPQSIAALEAGVHVLVEKPMAMDAAQAGKMLSASEESGALLMVAHCWRFDEEVLWVRKQLDGGAIGDVVRTKGYGVHANWGPGGWFTQKQFAGGGALADMGIHAIDTVRFLLGDPQPVDVYAKTGTYYRDIDVDDTGLVIVNWDNGTTSYIESGWWQPHTDGPEAATQLYGRRGLASLFPTYLSLLKPAEEQADRLDPGFPHPRPEQCPQSMYDAQMAYFMECMHSGVTPVPGGTEGLVNMRIVDAAYESSRRGQVVTLLERR
ncbi:MAG TPA: Gfo/Idh/MocA family oxidoreductase [Anaerolineae bacterium]|nr:Gfo/Idh/MocA family oxidoreductase [Anaerolineae bacterium]